MAKVLKTGGAGFIGSHVIEVFVSQACDAAIVGAQCKQHEYSVGRAVQFSKTEIDLTEQRTV